MPLTDREGNLHPQPSPDQPGTYGEQLAAIRKALELADERGVPAAVVWERARQLTMPHARRILTSRERERLTDD